MVTYGISDEADFKVIDYKPKGLGSSFTIIRKNKDPLKIDLSLPGLHMAKNAAAAAAAASEEGICDEDIVSALSEFQGVGRRFQMYGDYNAPHGMITLIDDYGHHPTEVAATIKAVRDAYPDRRLVMVFQPHRYSRTRDLYEDFVKVLQSVDELVLLDVYSAGEEPIAGIDGRHLCRSVRMQNRLEPHFAASVIDVPEILDAIVKQGDVVLTQGAGNVVSVARTLKHRWSCYEFKEV